MKSYRRIGIALVVVLALAVVARAVQVATRPAETPGQPQAARRAAAPATPGAPAGTGGPTSELLKLMGVDVPDFGIKVVQTFDASGKPAYETKGGDLLFFTNASVSYNSTADKPMIIVINARTRKSIAVADIDMPST